MGEKKKYALSFSIKGTDGNHGMPCKSYLYYLGTADEKELIRGTTPFEKRDINPEKGHKENVTLWKSVE